jgi:biopolymer transport protein ExbD
MSRSAPGGEKAEPNLTPILDMVFQLITFFMLVMNFKAAELDLSLQLPVIGSAKPLPEGNKLKILVLNVQVATKCPHAGCDAYATLEREKTEEGKLTGYHLKCERGHIEKCSPNAIANGRTCLSIYGQLLFKVSHGKEMSIDQYLGQEAEVSLLAAGLTRDDIVKEGKELPDVIVIRADTTCRFGAVDYIIKRCQEQGYRTFALRTTRANRD